MINKFMKICETYPVDYDELRDMLSQGFDINSEVKTWRDEKSLLANITMGWPNIDEIDENKIGASF